MVGYNATDENETDITELAFEDNLKELQTLPYDTEIDEKFIAASDSTEYSSRSTVHCFSGCHELGSM